MIHHGLTAELNALRIAELHAEAERGRRRTVALTHRRRRRKTFAILIRNYWEKRRPSITRGRRAIDSTAEQRA